MQSHATTTGPDTQLDDLTVFRDTIGLFMRALDPQPTAESLFPSLLCSVRQLKDHLSAYTFSPEATVYDEDAVIAIEAAERLLKQAGRVLEQPEAPERLS